MPSFHPVPIVLATAFAAALAAPALAGPLSLATDLRVEQRIAARDGTTRTALVKAARAVPGDRVVVVLTYRNTGAQPLSDVVLANPVPRGILYRAAMPGSPTPEVSVDGRTFGALASLSVGAGGGVRAAGPDDVTAVRWRLTRPIAAGAAGELAFQAVVR